MAEVARFIETTAELVLAIDAMDEQVRQEAESSGADNVRSAVRGRRTTLRVARATEWGEIILRPFTRTVADGLAAFPGSGVSFSQLRCPMMIEALRSWYQRHRALLALFHYNTSRHYGRSGYDIGQ